jgi:Asp-tRNA(Asn)/Glu-tRNA(Gln) amidotransferase A subunit family amidase
MSAVELLSAYKKGKLSPVEVVKALLTRIDEINPKINALVTRTNEIALSAAKESETLFKKECRDLWKAYPFPFFRLP